jgi:hypothetical protein
MAAARNLDSSWHEIADQYEVGERTAKSWTDLGQNLVGVRAQKLNAGTWSALEVPWATGESIPCAVADP